MEEKEPKEKDVIRKEKDRVSSMLTLKFSKSELSKSELPKSELSKPGKEKRSRTFSDIIKHPPRKNNIQKSHSTSCTSPHPIITETDKFVFGKNVKVSYVIDLINRYSIFKLSELTEGVLFCNGVKKNYDVPYEFSFNLTQDGYEGIILKIKNHTNNYIIFSKTWDKNSLLPLFIMHRHNDVGYTTEEFVNMVPKILDKLVF